MPSLEIIKPGLMTSIQDMGRKGLAYYAIPASGVMDKNAARIALLLLNKSEGSPIIECTSLAPQVRFNDPTQIAITGADFNWKVNDKVISRNTVIGINKGDILKGQFTKDGLRGYLAINGDLRIAKMYNSYSTYVNAKMGGFYGRLLKKGDIIEWREPETDPLNNSIIPIRKGPEFHLLSELSRYLLVSEAYKIGADSNRMGIRLIGPKLECSTYQLEYSLPVLPGFLQLPPSGLPIIVLQDGQTSGGYPRIAYIQDRHISGLNQIPLGGELRFELDTD